MDDLNCLVKLDSPTTPAFLNGDTAVCWTLEARELPPPHAYEGSHSMQIDIEEDWPSVKKRLYCLTIDWNIPRRSKTPLHASSCRSSKHGNGPFDSNGRI